MQPPRSLQALPQTATITVGATVYSHIGCSQHLRLVVNAAAIQLVCIIKILIIYNRLTYKIRCPAYCNACGLATCTCTPSRPTITVVLLHLATTPAGLPLHQRRSQSLIPAHILGCRIEPVVRSLLHIFNMWGHRFF